jgi:hypothetical protein
MRFYTYLAKYLSGRKMFRTKIVEGNEHFILGILSLYVTRFFEIITSKSCEYIFERDCKSVNHGFLNIRIKKRQNKIKWLWSMDCINAKFVLFFQCGAPLQYDIEIYFEQSVYI